MTEADCTVRDVALGVGILLLFASIIAFPISLQTARDLPREIQASREDVVFPDWTVSAAFNENEILLVYFYPPPNDENIPEPTGERYMYVDVTDPLNGTTTFNITFTKYEMLFGLVSNDGGLVVDENPPTYLGGTTQHKGNYTARVRTFADPAHAFLYYVDGEISLLEIYLIYETVSYPYFAAFPVAVALAAIGVAAIVWGARDQKRRTRPKRARRS